jgi:hypothetical protein
MSYGPAGYEDDWDDDQFDFGDHYDPEYSAAKNTENEANVKSYDVPKTSSFKNSTVSGGFGSPSSLQSSVKGTAGRGRGKSGGFIPSKMQNNFQSKKDVPSKKNKGQGNFLFARTKDKT